MLNSFLSPLLLFSNKIIIFTMLIKVGAAGETLLGEYYLFVLYSTFAPYMCMGSLQGFMLRLPRLSVPDQRAMRTHVVNWHVLSTVALLLPFFLVMNLSVILVLVLYMVHLNIFELERNYYELSNETNKALLLKFANYVFLPLIGLCAFILTESFNMYFLIISSVSVLSWIRIHSRNLLELSTKTMILPLISVGLPMFTLGIVTYFYKTGFVWFSSLALPTDAFNELNFYMILVGIISMLCWAFLSPFNYKLNNAANHSVKYGTATLLNVLIMFFALAFVGLIICHCLFDYFTRLELLKNLVTLEYYLFFAALFCGIFQGALVPCIYLANLSGMSWTVSKIFLQVAGFGVILYFLMFLFFGNSIFFMLTILTLVSTTMLLILLVTLNNADNVGVTTYLKSTVESKISN